MQLYAFFKIVNVKTKVKPSKLRFLHKSRPCLNAYLTNFVPPGMCFSSIVGQQS